MFLGTMFRPWGMLFFALRRSSWPRSHTRSARRAGSAFTGLVFPPATALNIHLSDPARPPRSGLIDVSSPERLRPAPLPLPGENPNLNTPSTRSADSVLPRHQAPLGTRQLPKRPALSEYRNPHQRWPVSCDRNHIALSWPDAMKDLPEPLPIARSGSPLERLQLNLLRQVRPTCPQMQYSSSL